MNKLLLIVVILLSCGTKQTFARQNYDSFIVKIFSDYFKVISPNKYDAKITAIIENKSQIFFRGKIQKNNGVLIRRIGIKGGDSLSIDLNLKDGELAYFVPQSPPFQALELSIGNEVYEIPQKK